MKRFTREAGFAVLAWLVPFLMSVCIYPWRQAQRPLFEIVMSLTLTANTALLGLLYLRRPRRSRVVQAIWAGAIWMAANWALDLLMFTSGPMQMPPGQYVSEIAGAYLVIPVITVALGWAGRAQTEGT